jgi:adhesin/invasin
VPISVLAAQPAILSTNGSGSGQGLIYRISGTNSILADSQSPASAGDALVIYSAGLGNVSPAVPAGSGAPLSGPLSNTAASVSVSIGGQPAQVLFAGLTPGFPGLYQVNAMVPNGVAAGNQVPVTVSVAGQNSIGNISMAIQ